MDNDGFKKSIPQNTYPNPKDVSDFTTNNDTNKSDCDNSLLSQQERYMWEICKRSPNATPTSTVLNSPDLIDTNYAQNSYLIYHHSDNHNQYYHQHQLHIGCSPVSQNDVDLQLSSTSPGSPTCAINNKLPGFNLIQEGEVVVFDDIDTNWRKPANVPDEDIFYNRRHHELGKYQNQNDDILRVTKMIGQLPIAEYEGSPRRFGNHQQQQQQQQSLQQCDSIITAQKTNYKTLSSNKSTNMKFSSLPPRPGFPQRISPNNKTTMTIENSIEKLNKNESNIENEVIIKEDNINLMDVSDKNAKNTNSNKPKTPTFDYLYEFSETRKVLEEFFKGSDDGEENCEDSNRSGDIKSCDNSQEIGSELEIKSEHSSYIGHRLARIPSKEFLVHTFSRKQQSYDNGDNNDIELYIDSNSRSSGEIAETALDGSNIVKHNSRNFTLSPEITDYDSNCGDLDSLSNDTNCQADNGRLYTSMPILEDGLSSGHTSDVENNSNNINVINTQQLEGDIILKNGQNVDETIIDSVESNNTGTNSKNIKENENNFDSTCLINTSQCTPPPPAPAPHRFIQSKSPSITNLHPINSTKNNLEPEEDIQEALKGIRSAIQQTKILQEQTKSSYDEVILAEKDSPIWVPRCAVSYDDDDDEEGGSNYSEQQQHQQEKQQQKGSSQPYNEDEEADTDLETDRLLGKQRLDDPEFHDNKNWSNVSKIKSSLSIKTSPVLTSCTSNTTTSVITSNKMQNLSSSTIHQGIGTSLTSISPDHCQMISDINVSLTSPEKLQYSKSPTGSIRPKKDLHNNSEKKSKTRNKEGLLDPAVLIEGVLFQARYLGSTQLVCEGQPTKSTRMMQAEEAVSRIKAPEGESQPSTEVDLFISTEKIMVLNTNLKEIMMDHALRTISYIADIGDLVVLMARRRFIPSDSEDGPKPNRTPKMICHVFESDEAQFIAQSIGQAFQVAYMEFLKANGIDDHSFVKEMDYQEVLNSQEIFGDELEIFAKKELQKEVVVPKAKGEILGVVIVESGWGSMLPTVVIANLMSSGAASRCGQLNIGDQLIAINGMSLVGLPLTTCQSYIRNTKNQTAVKFTVVPCPPVVEVKIKRPNTKYQLGFSVQNGVICSLLRGGIAERGGVRVGHRIIEINNQSVVAVPHEKIVNLLATSVGEILMKTMPTSMFRLLTGQENPVYI